MGPVGDGLGAWTEVMVNWPATACFRKGDTDGSDGIIKGEFRAEDVPWLPPIPKSDDPNCPGDDNKPSPERWSAGDPASNVEPNALCPGDGVASCDPGVAAIDVVGEPARFQVLLGTDGEVWKHANMM